MKQRKIMIHKGQIIFIFLGLIWCFICYGYLFNSGWWMNKGALSPMEFVGGIGGLCLPLIVLFLISAYFDRNEYLEKQSRQMRSYLEALLYPEEAGEVYTKDLTKALREQITEFRSVYSGVNQHTDKVRDNLQRWIEGLNKLVQTVDTQTVGTIQKMATHIQKLAEISHQSNQQAQETTTVLAGQADIVHSVSTEAKEDLAMLRQNLAQEVTNIQKLLATFDGVRHEMGEKIHQCDKVMQVMTENTLRLSEVLTGYEKIAAVSHELQTIQKQMEQSGDALEKRASHLKLILGQLHGDMSLVSQGLQAHTVALEKHLNMKGVQQKNFLDEASGIVQQLQEYSIDLAHLFTPKKEEELWQKYHQGDKTIFMRHISTELKKAQVQKVRHLFQQNIAFQTAVSRYMTTFEQMTVQAKANTGESPLLEILIGSDIGRLYMVLVQIIKGEIK